MHYARALLRGLRDSFGAHGINSSLADYFTLQQVICPGNSSRTICQFGVRRQIVHVAAWDLHTGAVLFFRWLTLNTFVRMQRKIMRQTATRAAAQVRTRYQSHRAGPDSENYKPAQ
jgi:hypothetical protein